MNIEEDSAQTKEEVKQPENYKFNIPSTTWEMNQLKEILNNHPWDIKVQIWLFDKSVSPEWFEKLKALLRK
jgi:lipopolysaccharide biosynthesis glycosyltransferase